MDGAEAVSAVPKAVVGCLVAEDENETDDDGEGWDLWFCRVLDCRAGWSQEDWMV